MLSLQISASRWGEVSHRDTYENPANTASRKDTWRTENDASFRNGPGTCVSDWHKIDTKETRFVLIEANENPADAPTSNGVKGVQKATQLPDHDSPIWASAPDIILRHFCGVAA